MKSIRALFCFVLLLSPPPALQAEIGNRFVAGAGCSLFLKSDGSVWGMGQNVALGSVLGSSTPVQLPLTNITAMAVGGHGLFVKSDGSLWAMGDNSSGQLGLPASVIQLLSPTQIVSSAVTTVAAGGAFSLFLKSDGSLWATGRNINGELGDGSSDGDLYHVNTPEQIMPSGVIAIAGGSWHSLFVRSDGSLWGMGDNTFGALGNGTADLNLPSYHNLPQQIVSSGVTAVAASRYFSLFLKSDGSLWSMGYNDNGQLGDGTMHYATIPMQVVSSGVIAIAAGQIHSLFLKSDGSLWAMGGNNFGQLGYGSSLGFTNTPQQIVSSGVVAISASGGLHSLFLKSDGSLWGMGDNYAGELGQPVDPLKNNRIYNPIQIVADLVSPLPAINSFGYSTGGAPIRSSNPWQFTAVYPALVSDLRLRVQSTLTTNSEASWTDLPGNHFMTHVDANWTLNTTDVPAGDRYFRVIAAAPGYFDSASVAVGPESVLPGFDLWGYFSYATPVPYSTATPWGFAIGQPSQISGISLRVQSSTSPANPDSWTDLPGGGQMARYSDGKTWTLYTTNLPTGASVSFRVIASAPNYVDLASGELGTFDIGRPLPVRSNTVSQGGTYTVQSLDDVWNGFMHLVHAVGVAVHLIHDGTTTSLGAISLSATHGASVDLQVVKVLTAAGINVGPNATLLVKGTINGNVGVGLISQDGGNIIGHDGAGLIGQDGSSVVSNDGGTVAQIAADIVAQGGGNIVAQGGGNIVAQGAGNIVAQGGGNIVVQGGENTIDSRLVQKSFLTLRQKGNGPPHPKDLTQPLFTGQMIINNNYDQFAGTLALAIAGTNALSDGAQQYDQLVVKERANLIGGTIVFGLFDPDDQTNRANVFQPPIGATFDVVVASKINVGSVRLLGPIWGDGLFFTGSVVTRADGLQAVRLVATHIPPKILLQPSGAMLQLLYATNYVGYAVQTSPSLSPPSWTTISTGTNAVDIPTSNASAFFRLHHP